MVDQSAQSDLVVFGATGFVGNLLCQYLQQQAEQEPELSWAIAGRSADKLDKLANSLGPKATTVPRLIADATDEASLRQLCAHTKVVISTVGPYALHGEPLVKVCAETGTDYCDLTGEPQWIRRMIQTYGAIAAESGARIVHCCGFDSIPSDLGVYFLQKAAEKQLGEPCIHVKMRLADAQGGVSGGTAASGINLVKEATEDATLRHDLENPYFLCPDSAKAMDHPPTLIPVQYDEDFQAWVTPFVMAEVNTRVVLRSNFLQQQAYGQGFQYEEGILTRDGIGGWLMAQGVKVGLDGFTVAAAFPPTRWLLENTILPASGEGPSPTDQENGFYDLRFLGRTTEGKTIRVRVKGDRDPGYGSTCKILGQAGICLAKDFPKAAKAGGFWTPAALFGETLIERLQNYAGLTFEVMEASHSPHRNVTSTSS